MADLNKSQSQTVWFSEEKHSRDADDPHIERIWMFAKEISKHLDSDEKTIDEADFFADRLLDKLESALMYYQMIKLDDFDKRNISQKRTIYEGLYSNLWSLYKGRVQNFLIVAGWNLSMFFCKEKNFESEAQKFVENNSGHEDLVGLAREQRKAWQNKFSESRNASEHSGDYRKGVETYETKAEAQQLFAQVSWMSETLLAYCGSYKMTKEWNVTEVNPGTNIFQDKERYIVEHGMQTAMREKRAKDDQKS